MLDVPSITIFGFNIVKFAVDLGNAYMLFLVVSLSLNLEAGYTGVPNFGKVMFMAGGAAISAAVCGQLAVFILGVNVHGNYNGYIVTVINQVNASLSKSPLLSVELVLLGTILADFLGSLLSPNWWNTRDLCSGLFRMGRKRDWSKGCCNSWLSLGLRPSGIRLCRKNCEVTIRKDPKGRKG